MILIVTGASAFCPVQKIFVTSLYKFLTNAHYEVLRPSEHRTDFILQTDNRTAFSSLSKMNYKKIFCQLDLQKIA